MTLSLVSKIPKLATRCTQQVRVEGKLLELVGHHRGIKEMELWLLAMSDLGTEPGDTPTVSVISDTIHRLIRQGRLIGVDYLINDNTNTFVLPIGAQPVVLIPINIETVIPILQTIR